MKPVMFELMLREVVRRNPRDGASSEDPRACAIFGESWEGHGVRLLIDEWNALGNPGVVFVTVDTVLKDPS